MTDRVDSHLDHAAGSGLSRGHVGGPVTIRPQFEFGHVVVPQEDRVHVRALADVSANPLQDVAIPDAWA